MFRGNLFTSHRYTCAELTPLSKFVRAQFLRLLFLLYHGSSLMSVSKVDMMQ